MKLGIFSKVFSKNPIDEAFQKISSYGMEYTQFNFANVNLDSLPREVSEEVIEAIRLSSLKGGVEISVISGTFNTLELDESKRLDNFKRFEVVCEAAEKLNVPYVSISTGSFNQDDFWVKHPDNHSDKGWEYLYDALDKMLVPAKKHNVVIVVEPEQANVVTTIEDTKRLMEHYDTKHLRVLFDAANIVSEKDEHQPLETITKAIHALKDYIVMAHCKDCKFTSDGITFAAVGKGDLPLKEYIKELQKVYDGAIIMHGLEEEDVEEAMTYLRGV